MLTDDDFKRLLAQFDRPWSGYRKIRKGVKKRIRRHMQDLGCGRAQDYLRLVRQDQLAGEHCDHLLLVTISRFYRDKKLWEHLERRILPCLADRFSMGVKAWSAGCAGGEEAYSLSMVWDRVQKRQPKLAGLSILATDRRADVLDRARNGVYGRGSVKEIPDRIRQACFDISPGGRKYTVKPEFRQNIRWRRHDLLLQPPEGTFHLILLRNNLLTYYQGETLAIAFDRIAGTLPPGGFLVVGSHERLPPGQDRFQRDADCPWVYERCCRPARSHALN